MQNATTYRNVPARIWRRHQGEIRMIETKAYRRLMDRAGTAMREGRAVEMHHSYEHLTPAIGEPYDRITISIENAAHQQGEHP